MDEWVFELIKEVHADLASMPHEWFTTEEARLRMSRNEAKLYTALRPFGGTQPNLEDTKSVSWLKKLVP